MYLQFVSWRPRSARHLLGIISLWLMCSASAQATTTIDMLLVYENNAASWVANQGGINAFSQDVINRMNQAARNSGLELNFRLAHAMRVDYSTTSDPDDLFSEDLEALQRGRGAFASVHQARNDHHADLVAMLIDHGSDSGYVGIGYQLTTTRGSPNFAFSVNAIRAVAIDDTLIHEVGHNMGADHAKDQAYSPGPGLFPYSAGWYFRGSTGTWYHTIMAYDDDGYGNRYSSAPLFSSPNQTHQGGVAGHAQDGDNVRTLNTTKTVVAAYRDSSTRPDEPVDPPDDPIDPSAQPDLMVASVFSPIRGAIGEMLELTALVANRGEASAASSRLAFLLSRDREISLNHDIRLDADCQVPTLAPGQMHRCRESVRLPATLSPGSYYLGAYADVDHEIEESDQGNNSRAAMFAIEIAPADDGVIDPDPFDPAPIDLDRSQLDWQVAEIYMATLGYAPDYTGLAYWVANLRHGHWTPTTVAQSFFDQPGVQALYPPSAGNTALIAALYRNIFDRTPDVAGRAYWLEQLNRGQVKRNEMVIALINGGWDNPQAAEDMARFGHRVQVSLAFANYQQAQGIVYSDLSFSQQAALIRAGKAVLDGVTQDPATVTTATARIPALLADFIASVH